MRSKTPELRPRLETLESRVVLAAGVIASYGFNEGAGAQLIDLTGNGHDGTISGAAWSSAGHSGGALTFDGVNDWVTVADADAIDFTTGMTLEAWIRPTELSGYRTVLMKEVPGELSYALYASEDVSRPSAWIRRGTNSSGTNGTAALPLDAWSFMATTYDGTTLRLYVDGQELGSRSLSGSIVTSGNPLRIGGNSIWGEYFAGLIDEVRVYDRALTSQEIQLDMNMPVQIPHVMISSPVDNGVSLGTNLDISYSILGDPSGFDVGAVQFVLDGGPPVLGPTPDGAFQFSNVQPGQHSLQGLLVRSDSSLIVGSESAVVQFDQADFRSIDGTNNNQAIPSQGSASQPLIRFGYDGVYPDGHGDVINPGRPNARDISNRIHDQTASLPNDRNLTDWVFQWGQFLTHDLDLTPNGAEFNVLSDGTIGDFTIPVTDPADPLGPVLIPFNRSSFDPTTGTPDLISSPPRPNWREQMNEVTSYVDASQIYGSDDVRAAALRTFVDGKLVTTGNGLLPGKNTAGLPNDDPFGLGSQLFLTGDVRGNEQIALTATHALFVREHNRLADALKARNPTWSDERLYQFARRIVGAEIQIITYNEFLPALLGSAFSPDPDSASYDANTNASITNAFSSAIFRFGHSMANPEILLVDDNGQTTGNVSLNQAFFNPDFLTNDPGNVELVLQGLATQVAQEVDVQVIPELRNNLFGPPGAGGLDLAALDIQRGRDHGLPDYNSLRLFYGLPTINSFGEITSDPNVQAALSDLYGDVNKIDAIVGVLAEDHLPNSSVGLLTRTIIGNQFSRLRDGDRFFYVNDAMMSTTEVTGVIDLGSVTLAEIIKWNTSLNNIQDNVFFAPPVPDIDPPMVTLTAPADGAVVSGTVTISADALDNIGVAGVQFFLDGQNLDVEDTTAPFSISWNTRGAANGSHVLSARARDTSDNTANASQITVNVSNASVGLVGAWGFETGSGSTAVDSSVAGNDGSIAGAIWTTAGRFGNALSFDGNNDRVNVSDADSLDLTTGMTLEAWVFPTALNDWQTVLMKEVPSELAYTLYAANDAVDPAAWIRVGGNSLSVSGSSGAPVDEWTHLASSYDGARLRLFVNGQEVGSRLVAGSIATSSNSLRIGGNAIWGEFFAGLIDEVRVYNRALTATEIQADMVTPVVTSDTTPPIISLTSPSQGATVSGTISITADASDNVAVAGVQFELDGQPIGAEDTTSPHSVSWDTTTVANGSYTVTAIARDASNNSTTSTALTVAVDNDTTAPTVSITNPANGDTLSTVVVMTADASDNVAVAGVQFELDGQPIGIEDTNAPFTLNWDSTTVANGTYALTAIARDTSNNTTTSAAATVTVHNVIVDTAPPTVAITSPADGATILGTVSLTSDASDNVAVAGVQFELNGQPIGAEDTTSPYSVSFDTRTLGNGNYTLTAVARDTSNNAATSTGLTITVDNDTTAPTVSITSPADGATVSGSISITADASDNVAVVGVQFELDGQPLGAEDTTVPYSVPWDTTAVAGGSFAIRALARDAAGNSTTSSIFTVTVSNPDDPAIIGQWEFFGNWPLVAVHTVLLPDGKVLTWEGEFSGGTDNGQVWDPLTNTFKSVSNPFSNMFCAAHVSLPDGRILVVGGHDPNNFILGENDANIFDPVTSSWTSVAKMDFRRWYPTATALSDGRVLVTSGASFDATDPVLVPEIYDPINDTWTQLSSATRSVPLYPHMFLLPDGRILQGGSVEEITDTAVLDLDSQTWTTIDSRILEGGSAVMYAPGKIMKSGSPNNSNPSVPAGAFTYVLDMNEPTPTWRETASMAFGRTFHNLTLLPDGTVLATSGGTNKDDTVSSTGIVEAELWSPETETWTTMDAMTARRMYHSTAILLPDARVLVSGGGRNGPLSNNLNAEIYSPPYLFQGPRPTITTAPADVTYGNSFVVATPDAANIDSVTLVRTGAATHGFDEDQRFLALQFTQANGELQIVAPANPNLAPPGHYMLFIHQNGVPSVAEIVRLPAPSETIDTEPPTVPPNLAASPSISTASLTWDAAIDDFGVSHYEIHRATTAGFTPTAGTKIGESITTSYVDNALAPGTYYYQVTAVDFSQNIGLGSNEVAATVVGDNVPPTVTLTSPADGAVVVLAETLTADASDNVLVAGVQFLLNGQDLGVEDTAAPYSIPWNTLSVPNGTYALSARARDASGNTATSANMTVTVSNTVIVGLVGAWGFELGSETTARDASNNGNDGAVSGATWSPNGRFGGALSFDGLNDSVTIVDDDTLDLTDGMTLEAWVQPTALGDWRTVLMKESNNDELAYTLYANEDVNRPSIWIRQGSGHATTASPSALPVNTWTHLASTYDGSNLRLYVNGAEVNSVAATADMTVTGSPLRIGGNSVWGEYFAGLIDEVRIYNRALNQSEIQFDMNTPVEIPKLIINTPSEGDLIVGSDVPITYSVSGDLDSLLVSHVHFMLDGTMMIMDPPPIDGVFTFPNVSAGAHTLHGFLVRADHSKIDGSESDMILFTVSVPETNPPTVSLSNPQNGSTISGVIDVTADASDDTVVAGVQFLLGGLDLGVEDTTAPYSIPWNTLLTANGVFSLSARARDPWGNTATSSAVTVTVSNTALSGLVGAWGFEQGSGATVLDASGEDNHGTIAGATWSTGGRFGNALSFDGINDRVNVPDAASLDLTSGMTLEAWVNPTSLSGFGTVVMKEVTSELAYALYANEDASGPSIWARTGGTSVGTSDGAALPLNSWTHLAASYDATTLRLYVNGVEVSSRVLGGVLEISDRALGIGGNAVWGEYFAGLIDEVRVYNRALTAAEIQTDMNRPVADNASALHLHSDALTLPSASPLGTVLTDDDLVSIAAEALRRWRAAGLTDSDSRLLNDVQFEIRDLPGTQIGRVISPERVQIDFGAAGYGWFVDSTPGDDVEFSAGSHTVHGVDLLSVVLHELGHVLGLAHDDDLMDVTLRPGLRFPLQEDLLHQSLDAAFAKIGQLDDH